MSSRPTRLPALAPVVLAGLCALPLFAAAGGITISPVVVEIESARKVVAVTVNNATGTPLSLQADTQSWRQVDGKDVFESSRELLVVPPMAVIPANGTQVFRVALRSPAASSIERTYRLVLEDVGAGTPATEGAGVAFRYTHNLPVMVAPAGKSQVAMNLESCASQQQAAHASTHCVRLTNAGNKRIKIDSLTVSGGATQETLRLDAPVNVLAGASREWLIPSPAMAGPIRDVIVHTAQGASVQARDHVGEVRTARSASAQGEDKRLP